MIDRDLPLKREISNNIKQLMKKYGWTQVKLSEVSGISKSTLSDYINCKTLINPGNVEKLSAAFRVYKSEIDPSFKRSDMVEETSSAYGLTEKEEKDIAKDLEKLLGHLESDEALAFHGDIMDEETKRLLQISLENSLRLAKEMAKKKFSPKNKK